MVTMYNIHICKTLDVYSQFFFNCKLITFLIKSKIIPVSADLNK